MIVCDELIINPKVHDYYKLHYAMYNLTTCGRKAKWVKRTENGNIYRCGLHAYGRKNNLTNWFPIEE